MRRIQLYIEEEVDGALAAEARKRGISKGQLIRDLVQQGFPERSTDPVDAVIGKGGGDPVDDLDRALYARP